MSDEILIRDTGAEFDREIPPAGPISAVCFKVFRLGAQMTKFGVKEEICITWEIDFRYKTGDLAGKRYLLKQRYTANMGEKSNLRKMLESWRGTKFDPTELKIKGFDIRKVEGRPALINIVHTEKGENTYANIGSVMKLPATFTAMKVETPSDFVPKYVADLISKQVVSESNQETTAIAEKGWQAAGEQAPPKPPTEKEAEIF